MFNHHFFDNEERNRYKKFLENSDVLMVLVDPPYGGLLEALHHTLEKISADHRLNQSGMITKSY